jgi:hypothetical protein
MVGHVWSAFSRDAGYQYSGGLPIVSVSGVLRHLGVDTCELVTPYTPDAYGRLAPGCGIVVERDAVQQFSGMVGSSRKVEWSASAGVATITVQCLGDDQHLADRVVYPSPALDPTAQTARRVPTLVMGADPATGVSRLWSAQFTPLLDTLTAWGVVSSADLGIRVVTTTDGLRADIYAPRDVSAGVRFSASLSNLTGWDYEQTPPSATYAISAGQGALHNRARRVASSASAADLAWGRRVESYVDQQDESDAAKLQQAALDAVAQGVGTVALSVTVADTPAAAYGRDWNLGDRVTVSVGLPAAPTAAIVTDLVREVGFTVDAAGVEAITPAVGTSDAAAVRPGPTQRKLAKVAAGLSRLTVNQ